MTPGQVFIDFLKLGFLSFGGPAAHFGYFHRHFVEKRQLIEAQDYAELMALCQFLPGPASSQMGMAIGYRQAGMLGSLAAFAGFTLPSALLMLAAGLWLIQADMQGAIGDILHGLKLLAVAVVADAVAKLYAGCCKDRPRQALALTTAIAVLLWPGLLMQLTMIILAASLGALMSRPQAPAERPRTPLLGRLKTLPLAAFLVLLLVTPWLDEWRSLAVFDAFYRAGALVFGGGHVVLPLLDAQPLIRDGMSQTTFLAGYSLAQAVPGPMFSLAAYLGTALDGSLLWGLIALLAIFLPGWLLLRAILPAGNRLRDIPRLAGALAWVTAATVGLLMAALFMPVFTSSVAGPTEMAAVIALWLALHQARLPIWAAVALAILAGLTLGAIPPG
ncbi:MAG: chromate efflux transporter [Halomonas sp.]|nr:chromate efflux transporter [Halomonas sp.]